jgi:hypothetical protein
MANRHRIRPQVESMEGRALLSAGAAVHGTLRGNYQISFVNGDATLSLSGSGRVSSLGVVSASGTLDPTGPHFSGPYPGLVTLVSPKGAATIELFGPVGKLAVGFTGSSPFAAGQYRLRTYTLTSPGKPATLGSAALKFDLSGHFTLVV